MVRQFLGCVFLLIANIANTNALIYAEPESQKPTLLPLWSYTPSEFYSPHQQINPIDSTIVQYVVSNQSSKDYRLQLLPIQGITAEGCSILQGFSSCLLTLFISGSDLTHSVLSGPLLCDKGNALLCYKPSRNNELKIVLNPQEGFKIGGTITGLTSSGLILQNNGTDNLAVSPGATVFRFSTAIPSGGSYQVTVMQQPEGLRCIVNQGSGTNVMASVSNVSIVCHASTGYVTSYTDNTVTSFNLATYEVGIPITVGTNPIQIAITPNGQYAYVTNNGTNTVTVLDLLTNSVFTTIVVGSRPYGIAITPDGTMAYVVNSNSNTVTPITIATNVAGPSINVGSSPRGIAITPDGQTAYVTNTGNDTVTPISLATNLPGSLIPLNQNGAWGIAITPDGTTAYVVNSFSNTVTPISLATHSLGAAISVGLSPLLIAITPDGKTAYVTDSASDSVTPISLATNTPETAITTAGPYGIAITADGKSIYVSNYGSQTSNTVTPIINNIPAPGIVVGSGPVGIATS